MNTAIQAIYRDMEYARSLIKRRHATTNASGAAGTSDQSAVAAGDDLGDEESWTFITDESDPDLLRRITEWEPYQRRSTSGIGGVSPELGNVNAHGQRGDTEMASPGASGTVSPGTILDAEKEKEKKEERRMSGLGLKFLGRKVT